MKLPHVNPNNYESMVRMNLLKSVSDGVMNGLKMQLGHLDHISNEKLVRIAAMLESESVSQVPELLTPVQYNCGRLPGVFSRQTRQMF